MGKIQLPLLTVDDVMKMKHCYDRDEIEGFFGGKKALTLLEILNHERVSILDRFWVLFRNDFFTDKELRLLACDFAEHTLSVFEKYDKEDKRPRQAIETARRFANGEATKDELDAAEAAAVAAARATVAAVRAAARAAAWAATVAAAEAAAVAAARATVAAAWTAARAAAWAAEQKWQAKQVSKLIKQKWGC